MLCFHLMYAHTKLCMVLTTQKCTLWHFQHQAHHQLVCYRWRKFPACMYLCVYRVVSVMHAMICTVYLDNGPQTLWCDPVATFEQVPEPVYPSNYYVFNLWAQAMSVCQLLFENGRYDGTYYTCTCILFRCCDVSLCISSAMRSYLFPLQQALSLALSAFKELVCICDHARMCTVEPVYLCITCK